MIPGLLSIWGDHGELQTTLKQPQPYIQVSMFITVLRLGRFYRLASGRKIQQQPSLVIVKLECSLQNVKRSYMIFPDCGSPTSFLEISHYNQLSLISSRDP